MPKKNKKLDSPGHEEKTDNHDPNLEVSITELDCEETKETFELANDSRKSLLSENYDKDVGPLLHLINYLRDLGFDDLPDANDMNLPRIVVVGQQSTGKSSVLESICGIDLPRGAGTVTRNPIEIRMEQTDEWSCVIKAGKNDSGVRASSESEIGESIRQACRTVLGESRFSNEEVIVELNAPYVPTLTLIDLPGLVLQLPDVDTEEEEKYLCNKVKEMATSYAEKDDTIILLILPATEDIESSYAFSIVREIKGLDRCVGVFTNMDVAPADRQKNTVKCLRNETKLGLEYGYYAVRNRSTKEVGKKVTIKAARINEANFFKTQVDEEVRLCSDRLGSDKLSMRLSQILAQKARRKLPQIWETLTNIERDAQQKLDSMPKVEKGEENLLIFGIAQNFSRALNREIVFLTDTQSFRSNAWHHPPIFDANLWLLKVPEKCQQCPETMSTWYHKRKEMFDYQSRWCMSWIGVISQVGLSQRASTKYNQEYQILKMNGRTSSSLVNEVFATEKSNGLSFESVFVEYLNRTEDHDEKEETNGAQTAKANREYVEMLAEAINSLKERIENTGEVKIPGFIDISHFKGLFKEVLDFFACIRDEFVEDVKTEFSERVSSFIKSRTGYFRLPNLGLAVERKTMSAIEEEWDKLTNFLNQDIQMSYDNVIAVESDYLARIKQINSAAIRTAATRTAIRAAIRNSKNSSTLNGGAQYQDLASFFEETHSKVFNDPIQVLIALVCFAPLKYKNFFTQIVGRVQYSMKEVYQSAQNNLCTLTNDENIEHLFIEPNNIIKSRQIEQDRYEKACRGKEKITEYEAATNIT